jgi:hypothetical protein
VLQVHQKAVSVPGRALAGVINKLKGTGSSDTTSVPEADYRLLIEYHSLVVAWLKAQSGAAGEDETTALKQQLDSKSAQLKGLVTA